MKAKYLSILLSSVFALLSLGKAATVTLAWDPNTELDLAGYSVYYGVTGEPATEVVETTAAYAHIPYLVAGLSYDFYVTAMNEGGLESAPSEKITYVVPRPAKLTVRWDASTAADFSHFKLYYKERESAEFNVLRHIGTSYVFTSFVPGKRYDLCVRGFNAMGKEVELYRDGSLILPGPGNWTAGLPKTAGKYIGYDAQTRGEWEGFYGEKAVLIAGGQLLQPQPVSGQIGVLDPSWHWDYINSGDGRLFAVSDAELTQSSWQGAETIQVRIPADGKGVQRLGVFSIDSERKKIHQNVEILDANSGAVLRSVRIGSFYNGIYLNFEINGPVILRVRRVAGPHATMSGIFLDSVPNR